MLAGLVCFNGGSIVLLGPTIPGRLVVRNQTMKQPIGPPGLVGLGVGLTTLPCKILSVSKPQEKLWIHRSIPG